MVGVAISATLGLSSCENLAQGPMSVRRDGSHMQIAVCTDITVVKVLGDFSNTRLGTEDKYFLNGSGVSALKAGDVVVTTDDWPGLRMSKNIDPDLSEGGSLLVYLQPVRAGDGFSGSFEFGPGGLSSKTWQHPDGAKTSKPCSGVSG